MTATYKNILSILRYYLIRDNEVLLNGDLEKTIDLANKLAISPIVSFVLN